MFEQQTETIGLRGLKNKGLLYEKKIIFIKTLKIDVFEHLDSENRKKNFCQKIS